MRHLGFAILGVLLLASLFGCRASKNATEKTEVKTEVVTSEKRNLQSEWERFIKNNLNITLEGIELEYEPFSLSPSTDTLCAGETTTGGTHLPFANASSSECATPSSKGKGKGINGKVKLKICKATIASTTEQAEKAETTDKGETACEVRQEEKNDKKDMVKNPQSETMDSFKWTAVVVLLIILVVLLGKWMKKRDKI